MNSDIASPFQQAWRGYFSSLLRWDDLERFWGTLRESQGPWYIYAVGEAVPAVPADQATLEKFITEIDVLLRTEHDEDYCGIVYADDIEAPRFVKIRHYGLLANRGRQERLERARAMLGAAGAPAPLPPRTLPQCPRCGWAASSCHGLFREYFRAASGGSSKTLALVASGGTFGATFPFLLPGSYTLSFTAPASVTSFTTSNL